MASSALLGRLKKPLNLLLSECETLRAVKRSVDRLDAGVEAAEKLDEGAPLPLPLLLLRRDLGKPAELPHCRRERIEGCGFSVRRGTESWGLRSAASWLGELSSLMQLLRRDWRYPSCPGRTVMELAARRPRLSAPFSLSSETSQSLRRSVDWNLDVSIDFDLRNLPRDGGFVVGPSNRASSRPGG